MFDNVLFPIIIAAAVVVLFAVAVISHTKRTQKAHYDERQLLARNAACRTSFFFLLFYCLVCGFFEAFRVLPWRFSRRFTSVFGYYLDGGLRCAYSTTF